MSLSCERVIDRTANEERFLEERRNNRLFNASTRYEFEFFACEIENRVKGFEEIVVKHFTELENKIKELEEKLNARVDKKNFKKARHPKS